MEVYEAPNNLYTLPHSDDNSLSLEQVVKLINTRSISYCSTSINKYLFSFCGNWLTIVPSGDFFRLLGRFKAKVSKKYIKRCADYDIYRRGTLSECYIDFLTLVSDCISYYQNELF